MAWPFLEPVDAEDAPDYYGVIKEPMGKNLMREYNRKTCTGNMFKQPKHVSIQTFVCTRAKKEVCRTLKKWFGSFVLAYLRQICSYELSPPPPNSSIILVASVQNIFNKLHLECSDVLVYLLAAFGLLQWT